MAHHLTNTPPLPGILSDIAQCTSTETALAIARAHGGTRVYFPAEPGPDNWLCKLVGVADAKAICARLSASDAILIPMGPCHSSRQRWRRMREMLDHGLPKHQIARSLQVHERTVQRHRNAAPKRVANVLAQNDLFENLGN